MTRSLTFYGHRLNLVVEALEVGFRTENINSLGAGYFLKTLPCCIHIIQAFFFFLDGRFLRTTMIAYDRLRLTKYSASAPDDTRFGLQAFSNLLLLLVVTATFASGQTKPSFFGRGKLNKYIFAHMFAKCTL